MSGLGFLDLVIGLVFIYFLLSMVVSTIQEIRANIFKLRSKNLEQWFTDTLDRNDLGATILKHKLISGLVKKGRKPSYIPSENFVSALLDTINHTKNGNKSYDIHALKTAIDETDLLPNDLKRHLQQSISEAKGELENVKNDITGWFDSCMDRVGGTYKNIQQKALIIISFVIVTLFNADSISLTKYLYENEDVRTELATSASEIAKDSILNVLANKYISPETTEELLDSTAHNAIENIEAGIEDLKTISTSLADTGLPLGWSKNKASTITYNLGGFEWLMKIVGLLISALAVSLGTPFWFDILNKLVNIRGAGGKPKTDK